MSKEIIITADAPAPIGPYNQAIKAGNLLFISGQIALKPGTADLVLESIAAETVQVMNNLQAILKAASAGFDKVVKTTIFLTDMNLFAEVNEIYGRYFAVNNSATEPVYPARETVAVRGLPKNVHVEISMIAVV